MANPRIFVLEADPYVSKHIKDKLSAAGCDVVLFKTSTGFQKGLEQAFHQKELPAACLSEYYFGADDPFNGAEVSRFIRHFSLTLPIFAAHREMKYWERLQEATQDPNLHLTPKLLLGQWNHVSILDRVLQVAHP